MVVDDVMKIFNAYIIGHDPEDAQIILPDGARVYVSTFARLFADAPLEASYDDLVGIDAGKLGYIPFFDQCKADGVLT